MLDRSGRCLADRSGHLDRAALRDHDPGGARALSGSANSPEVVWILDLIERDDQRVTGPEQRARGCVDERRHLGTYPLVIGGAAATLDLLGVRCLHAPIQVRQPPLVQEVLGGPYPTHGPLASRRLADGVAAVAYVRKHASDWGISADRVGIVGFSAGGTVTAGVGFRYAPDGRPAFVAPIYPGAYVFEDAQVPVDAPPMFIVAATDDQLGLAPDSIGLYNKWASAHKSVELHMYAIGWHGFGMKKQVFPSDEWINRFCDWLGQNGWLKR